MLRYLTSGESHGECLVAILEGIPAGLGVDAKAVDRELARRMVGFGRGKRMRIEKDAVRILSGLRRNVTIGSPIAMMIKNVDCGLDTMPEVVRPRPGHADLAGALKYGRKDIRDILERASARETAARVAVGAIAKILLSEFGVKLASHVIAIGSVKSGARPPFEKMASAEKSPVRCADSRASKAMCEEIEDAMKAGDTLGGVFEVVIRGLPPGLGSFIQWDKKIDAILAKTVMSIPAVKAVGFGLGADAARRRGHEVHDEIFYDARKGFYRRTNNAGGIEGGMTNGEDLIIQAAMKPISTLVRPLGSVNIKTKKREEASVERSDVCVVPAAGVIGEAVCAVAIADAMLEKFGGDSLGEMRRNYDGYIEQVRRF